MALSRVLVKVAALLVMFAMRSAQGQSFNIDIDIGFGDPGLGNGAPSSSFGAAAGQPGYWNRLGYGGNAQSVRDLGGNLTNVQMSYTTGKAGSGGGGAHRFKANTGDYALLLNDAVSVAPLVDGGSLTYLFSGLVPGAYMVFTYAVNIHGVFIATPVEVFNGFPAVEVVTGPMPGNSFQHLITHSVHTVDVDQSGEIRVRIVQPPGSLNSMDINGFQVAMVPEPGTLFAIVFGILVFGACRLQRGSKHSSQRSK